MDPDKVHCNGVQEDDLKSMQLVSFPVTAFEGGDQELGNRFSSENGLNYTNESANVGSKTASGMYPNQPSGTGTTHEHILASDIETNGGEMSADEEQSTSDSDLNALVNKIPFERPKLKTNEVDTSVDNKEDSNSHSEVLERPTNGLNSAVASEDCDASKFSSVLFHFADSPVLPVSMSTSVFSHRLSEDDISPSGSPPYTPTTPPITPVMSSSDSLSPSKVPPVDLSSDLFDIDFLNTEIPSHNCLIHPDHLALIDELTEARDSVSDLRAKVLKLEEDLLEFSNVKENVVSLEKQLSKQYKEWESSKIERDKETQCWTKEKKDLDSKIENLKKKFEKANKEKEATVIRYAKSEKDVIDLKKEKDSLTKALKDSQKETESAMCKVKMLVNEKSRLAQNLDNKNMELSSALKEIEKQKEEIEARDIKIKWAQNKAKTEMELHKGCSDTVNKLNVKISELESELESIRASAVSSLKASSDADAARALEEQLKEEQAKLILERHEHSERETQLKSLLLKNQALIEENNNLSFQAQRLEQDRFSLEERLGAARKEAQGGANTIADLQARIIEFDSISKQLLQEKERCSGLAVEVDRLRKANEELQQDMVTCRTRESDMLAFTNKLTTKNVQLQSEFSAIEAKAATLDKSAEKSEEVISSLRGELEAMRLELEKERGMREEDKRLLARQVAERTARMEEVEKQLEEARSTASGTKHKHLSAIRELQRELQVCKRKQLEESSAANQIQADPQLQVSVTPQVMVEKILRLQGDVTRLQEKTEFLEEHNAALTDELKKKGRLLHSYILREHAGALTNHASDMHKADVSRHGGIMASVYGNRPSDDNMTLELSLEINHKLQAILEDTLLKNITLKENIDTLGDEIAKLKKQQHKSS